MDKAQKSATIDEIAAQIEGAEAIFAVDYRGISVPQAAELRGKLREADASFRVVKNRLTKIAADRAGEERLGELLAGPTALTFVRGDTAMAAKAISTFNKEHEVLTFKGGFMDGIDLDEERFKSIARLPSRDVLNGQFAGVVASPLTGLVRGLGSMIQGLASQLGQIAEKGLVSGETEQDSADPPTAEAEPSTSAESDGEAESPSEEESQSDSSATSEGGESPEEAEGSDDDAAPVEEPPTESSAQTETPADDAPSEPDGEDDETSQDEETSNESEKEE